ncbi:MAG: hypothetical protein KGI29_05240 [Pseudomonadota bacterium]|nr:hypothetical protein [Pseudomonadota bacterium]MDE3037020.1 hypothetical protein [Pseudomonadota bacterium]
MSEGFHNDTRKQVVTTNIACIKSLLENALQAVMEADEAAKTKDQNMAIGCLTDIEPMLVNAKALYDATLYMHRLAR